MVFLNLMPPKKCLPVSVISKSSGQSRYETSRPYCSIGANITLIDDEVKIVKTCFIYVFIHFLIKNRLMISTSPLWTNPGSVVTLFRKIKIWIWSSPKRTQSFLRHVKLILNRRTSQSF